MASSMRATVSARDRKGVPISLYALALATSGFGKGFSTNILEQEVFHLFNSNFMSTTFNAVKESNLIAIAQFRALRDGITEEESIINVETEFGTLGKYVPVFDSGSSPAVKQLRHLLIMANCGALSFKMDEVGSNLLQNNEIMSLYLELYDMGIAGDKIIKNTKESTRLEPVKGKTPANMLLMGTPAKLLDGGTTEQHLRELLETGYGRRLFFGYSVTDDIPVQMTAEDFFKKITSTTNSTTGASIAARFGALANLANFERDITMSDANAIFLTEYRLWCKQRSRDLNSVEAAAKAELEHRYFKVFKLAGAYAFVDNSQTVNRDHIESAICMAEESGESFVKIMTRDKPHIRLAKAIAEYDGELTQSDLHEIAPYYTGTVTAKREMLSLAASYGYSNGIVITSTTVDGIEFIKGEEVEATNLDYMLLSFSNNITTNYTSQTVSFDLLPNLLTKADMHWTNHLLLPGTED